MQRLNDCARALFAIALLWFIAPAPASAIPVFANGQGVSCELCHTTFPGMTRYGMMTMMSNFQLLNRHLQDKALPIAMRLYITSVLGNKSNPASTTVSDLSFLGGGFVGRNFTWYTEQHVITSGAIGDTEQMWLSWNGLLGGTNSLQAGKFHTPFPFMPAHAWTLGNYLLATQTTGQNPFNPNDARWGVAFNGMSNEFMYNVSYLTGSGPFGDAFDYNASRNPRTLDFNISYGGMSQPWSLGLVALRGFAPLHDPITNAFAASDAFTREGLYYGYQTSKWHLQTMYYHGFDAHPGLAERNVPLNGYMMEIERDIGWRNHVLVRYDVAASDTLNRQYILDIAHNLQPNIALVGEILAGPGQHPQIGLQLAMAGPYQYGKRYLWRSPVGVKVVPANVAGTVADANLGAKLVAQSGCEGCHGANFQGGVGPKLYGIEHRLTPTQIADFIRHPRAPMPDFGFTGAQISEIVAYLSGLDGGAAGDRPTITFEPAKPATSTTIIVHFPTPPREATATAIMQMGRSKHNVVTQLKPTNDPHVWTGKLEFSMAGPWTIQIEYDGTTIEKPIEVGGGQ